MRDIYESALRKGKDLGAFFEADDDTAYFYLIDITEPEGHGIKKAVPIFGLPDDFKQSDVNVEVSFDQDIVALLVRGVIVAAFDFSTGDSFSLGLVNDTQVPLPDWVARRFRVH